MLLCTANGPYARRNNLHTGQQSANPFFLHFLGLTIYCLSSESTINRERYIANAKHNSSGGKRFDSIRTQHNHRRIGWRVVCIFDSRCTGCGIIYFKHLSKLILLPKLVVHCQWNSSVPQYNNSSHIGVWSACGIIGFVVHIRPNNSEASVGFRCIVDNTMLAFYFFKPFICIARCNSWLNGSLRAKRCKQCGQCKSSSCSCCELSQKFSSWVFRISNHNN